MTIRILLAAGVVLLLVACADSSTAPKRLAPGAAAKDITCRSGFHPATREDGEEVCEEDTEERLSVEPAATDPAFTTPSGITPPAPVDPPVEFPSLP